MLFRSPTTKSPFLRRLMPCCCNPPSSLFLSSYSSKQLQVVFPAASRGIHHSGVLKDTPTTSSSTSSCGGTSPVLKGTGVYQQVSQRLPSAEMLRLGEKGTPLSPERCAELCKLPDEVTLDMLNASKFGENVGWASVFILVGVVKEINVGFINSGGGSSPSARLTVACTQFSSSANDPQCKTMAICERQTFSVVCSGPEVVEYVKNYLSDNAVVHCVGRLYFRPVYSDAMMSYSYNHELQISDSVGSLSLVFKEDAKVG